MLKVCSAVLIALLATGCFSDDGDEASASPTTEGSAQSLASIFSQKYPDDERAEADAAPTPYTPPFGIQPLPKANLLGYQPSAADEAYSQKLDRDLQQQLTDLAQMDAVNQFNNAARDLDRDVQKLRSSNDAGSIEQVRRSFDAAKQANARIGAFSPDTSLRNQHGLNQIERPLQQLEIERSWVK